MSDLPYMPFYVSDYMGDTAHLTTLEHGAYCLLLMNYWQTQKPLPANPAKLARIAKLTSEEWAEMADTLAEFFQVDANIWAHKRVDAELERAKAKLEKAISAGKASAAARRNSGSTPVEPTPNGGSTGVESLPNHRGLGKDNSPETSSGEKNARAFLQFWELWEHRVGREAAEIAFAEAGASPEEILAGARKYIANRFERQQWPDPTKWLVGKRWLDEYAPRGASKGRSPAANVSTKRSVPGQFYHLQHEPAGRAWDEYERRIGKRGYWDADGGRYFPTEWPPDHNVVAIRSG